MMQRLKSRVCLSCPAIEVSDPWKHHHSLSSNGANVSVSHHSVILNNFAQLDKNRAAKSFTVYRFFDGWLIFEKEERWQNGSKM